MNNNHMFSFSGRLRSLNHASLGILLMLRDQHNAWVHAAATAGVLVAGIICGLSPAEWALLVMGITLVWVAEALNTAFEYLCDVASPEFHPLVKKSKDVAAGAVLLSALGAVLIGLLVFGPRLAHDFGRLF
ncbi:MAG: diacylglycerol kinase family protein [Gammaproteobacteria bacterium]|jgi:diacylglycerol kinase (ATP)|nr:diacylglycerol kinase family protein [Gammaproteobacteria bacterium]MDH5171945.1 diacylglycerol kinase family protein [Gammaproteobacteria bacterium]